MSFKLENNTLIKKNLIYNIDIEKALLSCCLHENSYENISLCIEKKLQINDFYQEYNKIIFKSILDLYNERIPINDIIFNDYLVSKNLLSNVGGKKYINTLKTNLIHKSFCSVYIDKIKKLSIIRNFINVSLNNIQQAYNVPENIDEFLGKCESQLFNISQYNISDSVKKVNYALNKTIFSIKKLFKNKGSINGISSGFKELDKLTLGFNPQEMIVIAARPSIGKTSILLNIVEHNVLHIDPLKKVPTLIFSLEMSSEQLVTRLLCSYSGIDCQELKKGNINEEMHYILNEAAKMIKKAPLWIDEMGSLTILEIRAKARRMVKKHNIQLIIIDYLQLLTGSNIQMSREQQISEISRGIKSMAKELNVPVIVAAQLNRDSDREKRKPQLSDLRESGSIEQDSDLVILLSKNYDNVINSNEILTIRDIILAKNRNGPIGSFNLLYNNKYTRFENYNKINQKYNY